MRYLIEPRNRVYVKGYGLLSLAKNLINKYSQKLVDTAKKSATDALKTASKREIQKTAEATGDLIGNNIADKITGSATKKPVKNLDNNNHNDNETQDTELIYKKRYISSKERQQIIDELRLVPIN